jgi:hypothetical protein
MFHSKSTDQESKKINFDSDWSNVCAGQAGFFLIFPDLS